MRTHIVTIHAIINAMLSNVAGVELHEVMIVQL